MYYSLIKMEAIALVHTVIKKAPIDSIYLSTSDKKSIDAGTKLEVKTKNSLKGHTEVTLDDGETWYLFNDHWKGLQKTFPNGVPMPDVPEKPNRSETIEAIIKYCIAVDINRIHQIAYVLATAEGESNFKPIREIRGKTLSRDQQRYWNTGYFGRGFIQVTWFANYDKVGKKLGLDLLKNPDLLLSPPVAIASLVLGMKEGWYTGKKLSDFTTYDSMRKIVNPGEISAYPERAQKFVNFAKTWEIHLENHRSLYGL
ncbi:MAG: glycoside hydrolase family 19 protein [Waterburya sp.]